LFGPATSKGDGQVRHAMAFAAGTVAGGLSAAKLTNEDGSTQDLFDRRELLEGTASLLEEALFHALRLYSRKMQ
jgi:hypothetical protein